MNGTILSLQTEKGYGFIIGDDKKNYFFHATDVKNTSFNDLEKNDKVTFNVRKHDDGRDSASDVRVILYNYDNLIRSDEVVSEDIKPGIHEMVRLKEFSENERIIIHNLSKLFYVTRADSHISLGYSSEYSYCLLKPTKDFQMLFNLERELIVVLANYDKVEAREFDVISHVHKKIGQQLRLDKMCSLVISKDPKTKENVQRLLKTAPEMLVIIPFSYDEMINNGTESLVISRFKECFYEKDLFAIESPLKEEVHFFGRRTYVNELISRHASGENSGVFGLRRSGKSSVLQAIKRATNQTNGVCVIEDCQDLYHSRWNAALFDVMKKIVAECGYPLKIKEDEYSPEQASSSFAKHLGQVLAKDNERRILLMFDEIEWISPSYSPEDAWKSGNDFIMFWQVIRKNFIQYGNRFTFILAGTNPSAIEKVTINGYDNPLFNQIKTNSYLPSFTVEDTSDMVNKLGGYMGLRFDGIVCSRLTHDFGGHPYLIRHFCSSINAYIDEQKPGAKPITITSAVYDRVMPIFVTNEADRYCNLIIEVLKKNYAQEYKYIEDFALGNIKDADMEQIDQQMLSHLMGYNILENNNGIYGFKIDILRSYLVNKNQYKKQNLTIEEKWAEISERRNRIETKLRTLVKKQLKFGLGEQKAKECVIKSMQPQLRDRYMNRKYDDLFDPTIAECYLSQLSMLIKMNWDSCFKNVFSKNRNTIVHYMENVNYYRADAHAADISDSELQSFRDSATGLENEIKNYFSD